MHSCGETRGLSSYMWKSPSWQHRASECDHAANRNLDLCLGVEVDGGSLDLRLV